MAAPRKLPTCLALALSSALPAVAAEAPLRDDQAAIGRDRIARVDASSTSGATVGGRTVYRAAHLADGRDWSAWGSIPEETAGAWVKLVFRKVEYVDRVEFIPGDARETQAFQHCGRPARLRLEGGGEARTLEVPDRRWQQVLGISPPLATDALKITFEAVHGKAETGGVCVSELKLAGPKDPFAAFPDLHRRIDEAISFLGDDQRHARGHRALTAIGSPALPQVLAAIRPDNPHLTARLLLVLGELGNTTAIHPVVAQLSHEDEGVRASAMWALGALRSAAHYDLLRAWYDKSAGSARDRAFDALARMGDERALDLVLAELVGGSASRRESAELALSHYGQAGVDALRPLLASTVKDERAAALRALGSLEVADARDILEQHLSSATDPELRAAAIAGLARRGEDSAHDPIAALWDSRYLVERQAVAYALGRFGNPEDLETLDLMTSDMSMSVRQAAAAALGRLGESAAPRLRRLAVLGPDGGTALEAARALVGPDSPVAGVVEILGSRHREVRRFAAAQLAERGEPGYEALVAAVTGTDDAVRDSAASELRKIGKRVLPSLLERAPGAPVAAQADILRLVAEFKDPLGLAHATRMLTDAQDLVVRRLAVEAIGACGDARTAATPLIAALQDKAVEVRLAALRTIGRLRIAYAAAAVVDQLRDPSREVSRAAVLTLGQIREPSAVDGLTALYRTKSPAFEDDPLLRQDIVATVGRIGGDTSLPLLMDAMGDPDVRVRFAAQDALY